MAAVAWLTPTLRRSNNSSFGGTVCAKLTVHTYKLQCRANRCCSKVDLSKTHDSHDGVNMLRVGHVHTQCTRTIGTVPLIRGIHPLHMYILHYYYTHAFYRAHVSIYIECSVHGMNKKRYTQPPAKRKKKKANDGYCMHKNTLLMPDRPRFPKPRGRQRRPPVPAWRRTLWKYGGYGMHMMYGAHLKRARSYVRLPMVGLRYRRPLPPFFSLAKKLKSFLLYATLPVVSEPSLVPTCCSTQCLLSKIQLRLAPCLGIRSGNCPPVYRFIS